MRTEILLSGIGGQGLVSTGEIMGQAASIFEDGLYATLTAAYGAETRGTLTKTDVIISDKKIGYPNVESPDIVLCLAQVAYDKFVPQFTDKTKIFYDTDLVKKNTAAKGEHIGLPFRSLSIKLGNLQTANIIALGVIIKKTGILTKESIMSAIKVKFAGKNKVINLNDKALNLGMTL